MFIVFGAGLSIESQVKKHLVAYEENDLYGFKNKSGKIVIKPQYEMAYDFTNKSVAFVVSKGKWKCINSKGEELLTPFLFDNGPDYYSEKLARFVENGKMGYFDEACKKTIPASFDFVMPFEEGFALVCNGCTTKREEEHSRIVGGKYGLINKRGKVVLPTEFDAIISIDSKKKQATVKNDNITSTVKLN
jgi:hypothetical protein